MDLTPGVSLETSLKCNFLDLTPGKSPGRFARAVF